MGELKKKLGIKKITAKNLAFLLLMAVVLAVLGAIVRNSNDFNLSRASQLAGIPSAQADTEPLPPDTPECSSTAGDCAGDSAGACGCACAGDTGGDE